MKGVAVQALAKDMEQRHVEGRLRIVSCYLMKNYACRKLLLHYNILTHSTNLILGGATIFTAIPRDYFDFASHSRMEAACDKEHEFISTKHIISFIAT